MVALTQNRLSALYAWFCHGRSHMVVHTCAYAKTRAEKLGGWGLSPLIFLVHVHACMP